jgi:hypothetical protein
MKHSPVGTISFRPISAAVIAILGLMPLRAVAAPLVTNCNDAGPNSLRQAVIDAVEGDTIDLTKLSCATITLTTGAIFASQDSLIIVGPGAEKLTIDGSSNKAGYNIFTHTGQDNFELDGIAIRHSTFYFNNAMKYRGGGCIFSSGVAVLKDSIVSDCALITGPDSPARGGAIYALAISLSNTTITHSRITSGQPQALARGGALFADTVELFNSVVSDSTGPSAPGSSAPNILGGGIYARANVELGASTITNNAAFGAAAIFCRDSNLRVTFSTISANRGYNMAAIVTGTAVSTTITNSTISGNVVTSATPKASVPSALALHGAAAISNSTIAFNLGQGNAGAVSMYGFYELKLYSSIVADNYPHDINIEPQKSSLSGSYNIIVNSAAPALPQTISSCPKLEPLAANGGYTLTHALQHDSPAIDSGINLLDLQGDQRGSPRVHGPRPDVGAFEWSGGSDDRIFNSGFDFPAGFCELR